MRRRWALIWLFAFAALAVAVPGLTWWTARDPALAGRSQALADASAFESALAARGRAWRAESLAAVFEGGRTEGLLLAFRWNEDARLAQPRLPPPGRELADATAGEESFTPARAWLAQARQSLADPRAALDAAQQGIAALAAEEAATAARLRLLGAQAALRAGTPETAVALLGELAAAAGDEALLDGEALALLAAHRLADALEAGGDSAAARLTREDLRARLLAAQLPVAPESWERELRFLREADGDGSALAPSESAAAREARLAAAVAAALAQDAAREGFALDEGVALLDRAARRGALFVAAELRASLLAAWREVLPAGGAWTIAAPDEAVEPGRTVGAVEPPPGLTGGWRLLLARPEAYVEAHARSQRALRIGAGVAAAALLAVGLIGRRALLRQAELERMRAEFIAGVSHELRTPAASLELLAENLAEGRVRGEERRAEYYDALRRDARRMQRLVADVLDASRLERDSFRVEPAPCAPAALLARVAAEHRPRLADAGLELRLDAPGALPEALLDADAIERALANLLENARKYASAGGVAILRGRATDGALRLEVEDRGPGLPAE